MASRVMHLNVSEENWNRLTALAKACGLRRTDLARLAIGLWCRDPRIPDELVGDELLRRLSDAAVEGES